MTGPHILGHCAFFFLLLLCLRILARGRASEEGGRNERRKKGASGAVAVRFGPLCGCLPEAEALINLFRLLFPLAALSRPVLFGFFVIYSAGFLLLPICFTTRPRKGAAHVAWMHVNLQSVIVFVVALLVHDNCDMFGRLTKGMFIAICRYAIDVMFPSSPCRHTVQHPVPPNSSSHSSSSRPIISRSTQSDLVRAGLSNNSVSKHHSDISRRLRSLQRRKNRTSCRLRRWRRCTWGRYRGR